MRSKEATCRKLNDKDHPHAQSPSSYCSTILSPNPSISIALRDAKCLIPSLRCAGQKSPPLQRAALHLRDELPLNHTGHFLGNLIAVLSWER